MGQIESELPAPRFLGVEAETRLPVWEGQAPSLLSPAPAPGEPGNHVELLYAALHSAVAEPEPAALLETLPPETAPLEQTAAGEDPAVPVPPELPTAATGSTTSADPKEEDLEAEVQWMAPRGLLALALRVHSGAPTFCLPALVPAPIFVYLQLPEALIAGRLEKPGLWWAGSAPAAGRRPRPRAGVRL